MKLSVYGEFVDDSNSLAYEDLEWGYSRLIIDLISNVRIMVDKINITSPIERTKPVQELNEYLKYNVTGFADYDLMCQYIDTLYSNIKIPVYTFQDKDESNPYVLYVVGKPGELQYRLKRNMTLKESIEKNIGVMSFGMKTGESLHFIKNYFNEVQEEDGIHHYFFREEYIPGKHLITDVFDADWMVDWNGIKNNRLSFSAFDFPDFCSYSFRVCRIYAHTLRPNKYNIEICDCDERPTGPENDCIVDGSSLYTAYYKFMVERGYFADKNIEDEKSK